MNDGPVCRCSLRARKTGIRHGIYPGEEELKCDPTSNNANELHHYRIVIEPLTNFQSKFPTKINYDNHDFVFEGFSLLSHGKLGNYPPCKMIRFNIEYTISVEEEKFPSNFTVRDIDLISDYIFKEILELVDLDWKRAAEGKSIMQSPLFAIIILLPFHFVGCPRFHLFPRFARLIEDDGKELLSPAVTLNYLLNCNREVITDEQLNRLNDMPDDEWAEIARQVKDMIVVFPGAKPSALRVDQLDRSSDASIKPPEPPLPPDDVVTTHAGDNELEEGEADSNFGSEQSDPSLQSQSTREPIEGPVIVHFGTRPPQLSYAGNPKYQKAWRDFVKFRHLLANKPKVSAADRKTLAEKEEVLREMRCKHDLKKDVVVEVSAKNCFKTGLYCDVIQHSLMVPVVICHLRFHQALAHLGACRKSGTELNTNASHVFFTATHRIHDRLLVSGSIPTAAGADTSVVSRELRHKSRSCTKRAHELWRSDCRLR